jgi:hypothetical protein
MQIRPTKKTIVWFGSEDVAERELAEAEKEAKWRDDREVSCVPFFRLVFLVYYYY